VVKFYAVMVRLGKIKIEDVPEQYRDAVQTLLN
jgi:hypothetical protein